MIGQYGRYSDEDSKSILTKANGSHRSLCREQSSHRRVTRAKKRAFGDVSELLLHGRRLFNLFCTKYRQRYLRILVVTGTPQLPVARRTGSLHPYKDSELGRVRVGSLEHDSVDNRCDPRIS